MLVQAYKTPDGRLFEDKDEFDAYMLSHAGDMDINRFIAAHTALQAHGQAARARNVLKLWLAWQAAGQPDVVELAGPKSKVAKADKGDAAATAKAAA